jgi:hypothetical protein
MDSTNPDYMVKAGIGEDILDTVYLITKHFRKLCSLPYDIMTIVPNNNTHVNEFKSLHYNSFLLMCLRQSDRLFC